MFFASKSEMCEGWISQCDTGIQICVDICISEAYRADSAAEAKDFVNVVTLLAF